jgi:hypothetical protein
MQQQDPILEEEWEPLPSIKSAGTLFFYFLDSITVRTKY